MLPRRGRDDVPAASIGGSTPGYFQINTTLLANGVHTIFWVVSDNYGRMDGIGSRYFTVLN